MVDHVNAGWSDTTVNEEERANLIALCCC